MLRRIEEFVLRNHMIEKEDRFVLGVSGGADSVCLFYVMQELKQKYNIEMVVVHVNHGIRGEAADKDEQFVRELCEKHKVIFECVHVDVKKIAREQRLSEEEAGRQVRYQAFAKAMERYGCNKIAVAHNRNDQSETVLLNLFRGSGLKGMSGIDAVRGKIVRPLLHTGRAEIENYLKDLGIQYQNDLSNFEDVYTRNKVRLNVLPYVEKEINTKAVEHIAQTAEIMSELHDFLQYEVESLYEQVVHTSGDEVYITKQLFCNRHVILQKELLRRIIFELAGKSRDIEVSHIISILNMIEKGTGKKVDLPYNLECLTEYDKLVLRKKRGNLRHVPFELQIELKEKGVYSIPNTEQFLEYEILNVDNNKGYTLDKIKAIPKNDYTKCFDYDKIKNTVLLRNRKTGDFFQCNSMGSKKKIKEYFINEKIPVEQRDGIQLLADGNHIMWIVGYRISEYYKVDNQTSKILIVKINGGLKNGEQN